MHISILINTLKMCLKTDKDIKKFKIYGLLNNQLLFCVTAVDMTYGTIYCFWCNDYVYDADLEEVARKQCQKSDTSLGWYFISNEDNSFY